MLRQENGPVLKSPNVGTRRGLKSQIALSACCRPRRTCAFKSLRPALDVLQPQIQSNLCWTSSNISPQNTHTHVDWKPGKRAPGVRGKSGANVAASHPATLIPPLFPNPDDSNASTSKEKLLVTGVCCCRGDKLVRTTLSAGKTLEVETLKD